ncbi:EboA domain-containing protein [Streptomyces sp. NPDC049040]|uniref:EboA domain-containing protein n=1 Tax=Streptomyces sp. NPDC049040 TaxID=3365593 RepID=UPI00371153DA
MTSRSPLRFGYGTNGFANHRFDQALDVIAGLGYEGVALTLDHAHLDPFAPGLAGRLRTVRRRLDALGLAVVVETGARYLLDPWHKHSPTLLHEDAEGREARVDFLERAIRIGAGLGAEAVSLWSGVLPAGTAPERGWDLLTEGCGRLAQTAAREGVVLGFEPEPGMLVADLADYRRLRDELGAPASFRLTLDIGHCRCLEREPVADCVRAAAPDLVNVQIDDMRRGVHEHLEFGEGEIDFTPVLAALAEVGYGGLVAVELPRHSHSAPQTARRSLAFLRAHAQPRRPSPADAVDADLAAEGRAWLAAAVARAAADPAALLTDFPAAARACGRGPLTAPGWEGWTVDEAARAVLLGGASADTVADVYARGDRAERRAVLRALPWLDLGSATPALLEDALRTNDGALVAAALGPAAAALDAGAWRQGVLKCVFLGVPLTAVAGLGERTDAELARMLLDFAHERVAAGRDVPADVLPLVRRFPALLDASPIHAEAASPEPRRAEAARRVLAALR